MALEILFNLALILLSSYCIIYVNSSVSGSVYTDPLGAVFWPKLLLTLLIVLLTINVIQIYFKTPADKRNLNSITKFNISELLHSRLTWGIVLMLIYAFLLPITGFILTSFLMGAGMCFTLGEKRPVVLVVFPLAAVLLLFIVFYKGMSIQLPRGTVPLLRSMAIAVETLLRNIGR